MTEQQPRRGRWRWWVLLTIVLLPAATLGVVYATPFLDDQFHLPAAYFLTSLTLLLTTLWMLFLSGLSWRVRLGVVGLVVLGVGLVPALFRFTGMWGGLVPQFEPRWRPIKDYTLSALPEHGTMPEASVEARKDSDFPEFRGPGRRGLLEGVTLVPDWARHPPRQVWRHEIGQGWSAFAVVGAYAVTQEQRGDQELVSCYDLETGAPRWSQRSAVRFVEAQGGDGPRATPTIVGDRVYALGATGLLHGLDLKTGKVHWTTDTLGELKQENLTWGKSSSPLVHEDLVIVSLGEGVPSLAAYDCASGKRKWTVGEDRPSYASPVLATVGGRKQVLVVNAESVSGHDPATGQILWKHAWPGKTAKCSDPVPVGSDQVFVSAGLGLGALLLEVKQGGDGKWAAREVWSNNRLMRTYFTNVVLRDGYLYGLDNGFLQCLDAKTGDVKWREGRYEHGQVLGVGDALLVQGEKGPLFLVEATPQGHRRLGKLDALEGKTWNNPALAGRYLLVRNGEEAACYRLELQP
jgi:outer membrane protein assembly factor BamB